MVTPHEDFNNLLLDSIDTALLSLGKSIPQKVYLYIEKNHGLPKPQIPHSLKQFQYGLEKLFGIGARYIEILIMKNLYRKIQHPLNIEKTSQLEFIQYVAAAKQGFLNSPR
ncbi:MAG: hypothetical protein NWF04_06165 [Candidatus Bathyarchaeota archaeon]|nr:hypothetical protein [Candidatus Bathyarchaeota archaeon]